MAKCNLLLQDDGANSNEINDTRETRSEIDGRVSREDPPDDGLSQNGTNVSISVSRSDFMSTDHDEPPKHEAEAVITVQTISHYGSEEKFTPRDFNVRPGTRPAGEHHSISVSCFARISGQDAKMVAAWARLEQRFLELDFHFPGLILPLFTIRILVVEDQEEDISLSGGLGFAHRTLKSARAFDLERASSSRRRRFPPIIRKRPAESSGPWHKRPWRTSGPANRPPPFTLRDIEQIAGSPSYLAGFIQHQPAPMSLTRSLPSLPDTDDQLSVSTDYTGASMETPPLTLSSTVTNWVDDNLEHRETFETPPGDILETGVPFFGITDDWVFDHVKGRQYSTESFKQQKQKAEAMYAHNGDTSGMVAIMALASASPSADNVNIFHSTTKN